MFFGHRVPWQVSWLRSNSELGIDGTLANNRTLSHLFAANNSRCISRSSIISTVRPRAGQGPAITPLLSLILVPTQSPGTGTYSDSGTGVFLNKADKGKCLAESSHATWTGSPGSWREAHPQGRLQIDSQQHVPPAAGGAPNLPQQGPWMPPKASWA